MGTKEHERDVEERGYKYGLWLHEHYRNEDCSSDIYLLVCVYIYTSFSFSLELYVSFVGGKLYNLVFR